VTILEELCQCVTKGECESRLANAGRTYNHVTVTDLHSLKQLNDLLDKCVDQLQILLPQIVLDCLFDESIVNEWYDNCWEQVFDDTREQRQIM
jgi:hypothetical protein